MPEVSSEQEDQFVARVNSVFITQLGVEENMLKPDANIVDDLGADSLDIIELVMAIEEEFEIDIPDDDAEKVVTVNDAYGVVARLYKPIRRMIR